MVCLVSASAELGLPGIFFMVFGLAATSFKWFCLFLISFRRLVGAVLVAICIADALSVQIVGGILSLVSTSCCIVCIQKVYCAALAATNTSASLVDSATLR